MGGINIPLKQIYQAIQVTYLCANQAPVTIESFSRMWPNSCGLYAITTTAFWTVLLVTSAGRSSKCVASICRVHEIPNIDVAGEVEVARRVK